MIIESVNWRQIM